MLRSTWFVFAVGLLMHGLLVVGLGHYRHPAWMESGHIASNLYEGKGFSYYPKSEQQFYTRAPAPQREGDVRRHEGPPPFAELHPTSIHPPGYPFLLFAIWRVAGRSPAGHLVVSLLQAVLVSSVVFPVRRLTLRWFGDAAAIVAMWIACLMPLYAYYACQLLPVAVFITLHPWLLAAWLWMKDRLSWTRAVIVGVITGLASLFQPLLLGVFGAIGLGLFVDRLRKKEFTEATVLTLVAAAVVVVLTPWTIRNYRVHGAFVPIRSGAGPFWIGNNPHATGTAVIEGGKQDVYVAYPPQCVREGTVLTEIEYHSALGQEAWEYIRRDPRAFVRRTLKKIVWFWTWVPEKYVNRFGEAAGLRYRLLYVGYWSALVALLLTAVVLQRRLPAEYLLIAAVYVVLCSLTYGLLHVGQARFRGEIEYIFIPVAAQGMVLLWRRMGWTTPWAITPQTPISS